MGMKIYLLRHAESETNELGIRSSSSEDSLTDLGDCAIETFALILRKG